VTEYLDRIAYVAEAHDAEEPGRLSGRFGVGWASEDGEEHGEGPEYLSAEEAITWAREHAPRVLVRIDADTHFTAGELPLDDDDGTPLPAWPEEGVLLRPRPWGSPLDGSVQEIDWQVRAEIDDPRMLGTSVAEHLNAALSGDPRIHSVHVSTSEQQTEITCAFLARNVWIVTLEGNRIISAALRAAVPELADKGDHQIGFSLETLWPTSRRDAPST
jgi:hypothetical protein